MALNYNLKAEKGSNFTLHLRYLNDDETVVDLIGSGYTAAMQVRRHPESTDTLLNFASSNGPKWIFGQNGVTAGDTGGSGGIRLNASYTGGTASINLGVSGSTGGIYITADSSTMKNVPTGNHFYEIDLLSGTTTLRLLEGRFEVVGNVRR
tara:strand:+ start:857 stop:1309 length:453 start_codon:yes stop_codon:yes gene_type:complete